jgi:hypothetical protein
VSEPVDVAEVWLLLEWVAVELASGISGALLDREPASMQAAIERTRDVVGALRCLSGVDGSRSASSLVKALGQVLRSYAIPFAELHVETQMETEECETSAPMALVGSVLVALVVDAFARASRSRSAGGPRARVWLRAAPLGGAACVAVEDDASAEEPRADWLAGIDARVRACGGELEMARTGPLRVARLSLPR